MTERRSPGPLAALRAFARERPAGSRCEVCAGPIGEERAPGAPLAADALPHEHLLDPARRAIRCACAECAVLEPGRAGSPWRRVPRRVERLPDLALGEAEWESLLIPINVAFFVASSVAGRTVAFYPSPAGATEAGFPLEAWDRIAARSPRVAKLAPDIEALLVNRAGTAREHWVASIDLCYRLVGLVRRTWRGFTGGAEVKAELARFFAGLEEEAHA